MRIFEIGKPKPQKEDGYYVKIKFMYGDADGYTKKKIGPFKVGEERYLNAFLDMLDKCLKAFPNGMGGGDTYEQEGNVQELKLWNIDYDPWDYDEEFELLYNNTPEEMLNFIERIKFTWPYTPNDWNEQASIEHYKVEYYSKGIVYKVNIKCKE